MFGKSLPQGSFFTSVFFIILHPKMKSVIMTTKKILSFSFLLIANLSILAYITISDNYKQIKPEFNSFFTVKNNMEYKGK